MTDARITLDAAALKARIATLEAELASARLDADLAWKESGALSKERNEEAYQWMKHANALRDAGTDMARALEKFHEEFPSYLYGMCALSDWNNAVLSQTPAASLRSHDAEVLERAATCAESFLWNLPAIQSQVGANCGDAIRALAAQEVTK